MSVPPNVPADVPASEPAGRCRRTVRAPRFLTGSPSGWRFQIRLPARLARADSAFSSSSPIVRTQIGARPRRDAERMARRMAVACQTVFDAALTGDRAVFQSDSGPPDDRLAQEVVAACQAAIARALAEPAAAVRIAGHLGTALDTLRLVQAQVGEGRADSSYVAANAEGMVRGALADLLTRFSPEADRAGRMLETTAIPLPVAPGATPAIP